MKSMTGFGRGQFTADGVDILAEVRSVNHRFLECTDFQERTVFWKNPSRKPFSRLLHGEK